MFFNKLQTIDFDDILKNPKNIKGNSNILSLLRHLKVFRKHVMASSSSRTMQRDQIFSMINFIGTLVYFHFKSNICPSSFSCFLKWAKDHS
jgi:hypothetical protein